MQAHFRSAVIKKGWKQGDPIPVVKLRRGGPAHSNSGPSGYKLSPSRVRSRALADMAKLHKRKVVR